MLREPPAQDAELQPARRADHARVDAIQAPLEATAGAPDERLELGGRGLPLHADDELAAHRVRPMGERCSPEREDQTDQEHEGGAPRTGGHRPSIDEVHGVGPRCTHVGGAGARTPLRAATEARVVR